MDQPDDTSAGARGEPERSAAHKSTDAFRTIGEVADELKLPQHVLRFWETRFPQVKPMKRAGGRRFYRPEDVALLRAVQALLYGEGYTIKGVQRLFGEFGARQVAQALARSAQVPAGGDVRPPGPLRDGRGMTDAPSAGSAEGRDPSPALPSPAAPPAEARPVPARAGHLADSVARLESVLAELVECNQMLLGLRSTRN